MEKILAAIQFGPHAEQDAEAITCRLLDGHTLQPLLEELLRGDITAASFLVSLQHSAESIYADIKELEDSERREAVAEMYHDELVECSEHA